MEGSKKLTDQSQPYCYYESFSQGGKQPQITAMNRVLDYTIYDGKKGHLE